MWCVRWGGAETTSPSQSHLMKSWVLVTATAVNVEKTVIILIWKFSKCWKRPISLFYSASPVVSPLICASLFLSWGFTCWLVFFFIRCDKVRSNHQNSPMSGPVAMCNEQWRSTLNLQSLPDAKRLLKQRCLKVRCSFWTLTIKHHIKGGQHLLSALQNWGFKQRNALGVVDTESCMPYPKALCPC